MKNDHAVFDAMPKPAMPSTPGEKERVIVVGSRLAKPSASFMPTPKTSRYPSG